MIRGLVTGAAEIRAADDGQHLHGTLIQEGRAASGGRREVFTPGSVEWPSAGVGILTAHRTVPEVRAIPVRESDGRITVTAPATDAIQEAVEGGRKWMSVEFHALQERTTAGGVREVLRALVPDVALVDSPEYDTTSAEVRRRLGGVKSGFPLRKALDRRCGPADCSTATIDPDGLVIPRETPAFLSDFKRPLGPAVARVRDGAVTVSAEVRDTSWGRDLLAAGVASLIVRPYPDPMESSWEKRGTDRYFSALAVAAWIYSWTDQTGGFDEAEIERRRRVWL